MAAPAPAPTAAPPTVLQPAAAITSNSMPEITPILIFRASIMASRGNGLRK
jgi:hypothetical protein